MSPEALERALAERFAAAEVSAVDESALHAGHRPGAPSEGTHWAVLVVSERFRGMDRLERHRAVHAAAVEAVGDALHALRVRALTPEERAKKA